MIVVNDGSTDNTLDIIKNLKNSYPDVIKIIENEWKLVGLWM